MKGGCIIANGKISNHIYLHMPAVDISADCGAKNGFPMRASFNNIAVSDFTEFSSFFRHFFISLPDAGGFACPLALLRRFCIGQDCIRPS